MLARFRKGSVLSAFLLVAAAFWIAACAASLGPGYRVEKQSIEVSFLERPEPVVHVVAEYQLKNTGNQDLDSLDVRLPGRRFRPSALSITWDGAPLSPASSPDNPRDTLLSFEKPWAIGAAHTVHLAYDLRPGQEGSIAFTADAFHLPAGGWTPSLPQARGVFGFGGVPPKKWELLVRVPEGFLVHASGRREKRSARNSEIEFRLEQTAEDLNCFVVAGRYHELTQNLPAGQRIHVWSRREARADELREAAHSLAKALATYDSLFGSRGKTKPPLWIIECPADAGCFSPGSRSPYSAILYGNEAGGPAEMISRDTVLVDPGAVGQREAIAGPAVAAGWLGYGQNPGFYEQQPPMSALPAFAAALAREASSGAQVREQIIRRAIGQIPENAAPASNGEPDISRAKGLLLFYALLHRVGPENFHKAMQHMLSSRQERGFDITDLISALEQESHQTVGPFVREWIKRPGIPAEFRAMYSQSGARQDSPVQEATTP